MNYKTSNHNNNEIDLLELFRYLKKEKKIIASITGFFTIIALIYSLFATPYYSAFVSIYPMGDDGSVNTSIGDLQGLASSFGINIGSGGNTSFYIPDIIQSRKLRKAIVRNKWDTTYDPNPIDLISLWGVNKDEGFSINNIFNKIISPISQINPEIKNTEIAMELLMDQITIDEEDSGLLIISVLMEEPQLAADIANYIANYVKSYISEEMTLQSTKYRIFIEERLKSSKKDLKVIEEKLNRFRKNNPLSLDTPDLQLERARLIRDVEINQEVYLTLLTQYELAKIEELKETPVINVLDNAEAPIRKDSPKRKLLVILGLISGLFFGSIITLLKYFTSDQR